MKSELLTIINFEKENATRNIKPITEKAIAILKKSSNPYIVSELKPVSFYKVFSFVRKYWEDHNMNKDSVVTNWSTGTLEKRTMIENDALDWTIDEIITNIKKYHQSFYSVNFEIIDNQPALIFKNDLRTNGANQELNALAQDFNTGVLSEKMKRSSYGLSIIKQYLQQLDIKYKIYIENDVFHFQLVFTITHHENSNLRK